MLAARRAERQLFGHMSFLISLLLPVLATVIFFRAYPARAARGEVSVQLGTGAALARGALTGAAALVFLSLAGVVILAYRGKAVTPDGMPAVLFWISQFLFAAGIGAAVGTLSTLALLPWVRGQLARITPPAAP